MNDTKRKPTLTGRITFALMVMIVVSNLTVGLMSYILNMNNQIDARAKDAENVAVAMAVMIDGDKFTEIMGTLEKNEYWYEVKKYADNIAVVFETAYLYILDKDPSNGEMKYFAEGAPGDSPYDLGMTDPVDIFGEEMFETIDTGKTLRTKPYVSGEYGEMVSGFAAITNDAGDIVGVVGVDFFFDNIFDEVNIFGLTMLAVIAVFLIIFYTIAYIFGRMTVGKPLTIIDETARQLALGNTGVSLDIRSKSELGRLSASFNQTIDSIRSQVTTLEKISDGDLSVDIIPRGEKDTMSEAIEQILIKLNEMFREIENSAFQVSTSAKQVSDNAQLLAHGAGEQAETVSELSSVITEVAQRMGKNKTLTAQATNLTDTIKNDAQTSTGHMDRMIIAVKDIAVSSESIGNVIKVIDEIAFQTNILALNAAVEAARAGQHGKGFAVVAGEVRNLAAKSAEAARNTRDLISNSIDKAKLGEEIAGETAESLVRIIDGVNNCASLVGVITESFENQLQAMNSINSGIDQVSQIVQSNSANAEQSAAASEEMSGQADVLKSLIARFKLKPTEDNKRRY